MTSVYEIPWAPRYVVRRPWGRGEFRDFTGAPLIKGVNGGVRLTLPARDVRI